MNGQSLLLASNKMTHGFKEWTALMPQNSSCSQKLQYPERKLRLKVLRKDSSLEKEAVSKVTPASANVYNCSSKTFTTLNE